MNIEELHMKLLTAYSSQNLNKISVTLIHLYKNEQYETLEQIALMISETTGITIDRELRYFSKLMMLYHPDRGNYHRMEIDRLAELNDYDALLGYSHILSLERIEEVAKTLCSYEDIDYTPVYEWDLNEGDFHIVENDPPQNKVDYERPHNRKARFTFYDAFQRRMFGNVTHTFPVSYFADIEEFELAQSGINDLQGVQYCIHVKVLDLSGNSIHDISYLWDLSRLEELNLSDNRLEIIDTLSNLQNLRSINLSDNSIIDISPLFQLNRLEYVELSGNKIHQDQIKSLEDQGVVVVTDS